jgi:hypothetical protein
MYASNVFQPIRLSTSASSVPITEEYEPEHRWNSSQSIGDGGLLPLMEDKFEYFDHTRTHGSPNALIIQAPPEARCSDLISSGTLLDYIPRFRLELGKKSGAVLLALFDNKLGFGEKNLITCLAARIN